MTQRHTISLLDEGYWERACIELGKRDPVMQQLIATSGKDRLQTRGEPFQTLARSIVGQQISVKAADAIWKRLLLVCPVSSPEEIMTASAEMLTGAGLSRRKVEYLKDLAFHFLERKIQADRWPDMSDEDIIADMTQVRGIGRWTAEMFLIFNLLRPNVLPLDDVGLLKGISMSYFSGEDIGKKDVRKIAQNWEPWCTVATWYLWRSLTPLPVEY